MSAQRRADLTRYFLRLGALGFGGPVALVARMRQDLVDGRGWIAEEDFRDGLALAQVAPGPLAAQLAMYLGWLVDGVLGATVVGVAFVLPSLLIVLVLAAGYARAGGLPIIGALFYGVGAAVIAVLARAGYRLARSTIATDRVLWFITGVNAVATVALRRESVLLVLLSGLFLLAARAAMRGKDESASPGTTRPLTIGAVSMLSPLAGIAVSASSLPALFVFFAVSGLVVFGSGLAIVPFLHGGVVVERHWLTEQQFLDAVAVSLLTPGPVVITVAFIGFLVAGMAGGIVAAMGVFLPAYLVVLLLAPRFGAIRADGRARTFASGVTAAAVGALLGAVVVMGTRTLVDLPTAAIAVAALVWLLARPRVPEPLVLAAAAVVGFIVQRWS
ncbi:MAG: chromate transporter [Gemmatimonadetes bacterium]|nr:MAG: chromate transporter [Gemmatimonadota bacterium]HMC56232.1 chromate efflux transporter [Gemmatimonadaceae bacterium]